MQLSFPENITFSNFVNLKMEFGMYIKVELTIARTSTGDLLSATAVIGLTSSSGFKRPSHDNISELKIVLQ